MKSVVVEDYNPQWPAQFEVLRAKLWSVLSGVADSIEHVGSTAVPNLAAKPIIDVSIIVSNEAMMQAVIERLAAIGVYHRGDLGIAGREAFTKLPDSPAHNLYACIVGSQGLRNHLAIRDYLRAHDRAARAYGKLKKELARRYPEDIDAYLEGKSEFLLAILEKLGFSVSELEEIKNANRKPDSSIPHS